MKVIQNQGRIHELNFLRAIACLSVIFVHITSIPVSTLRKDSLLILLFSLLNRAAKFTTPTFIFLSGLTLTYTYLHRELKYGPFLKKRLTTTLIPYFIWTCIYYGIFIHRDAYVLSWKFFIENLLLANMSYHFYFILIILQFYLLFGGFLHLFKRYNRYWLLGISGVVNLLFVKYVYFQYVDRFFMKYIFFFSLGCFVALDLEAFRGFLKKYTLPIGVLYTGITLYYGIQFYQYYGLGKEVNEFLVEATWLLFCFIAILFLYRISLYLMDKGKVLDTIGKKISGASYYVYLIHPLLLYLLEETMNELGYLSITRRFVINMAVVYPLALGLSIGYRGLVKRRRQFKESKGYNI